MTHIFGATWIPYRTKEVCYPDILHKTLGCNDIRISQNNNPSVTICAKNCCWCVSAYVQQHLHSVLFLCPFSTLGTRNQWWIHGLMVPVVPTSLHCGWKKNQQVLLGSPVFWNRPFWNRDTFVTTMLGNWQYCYIPIKNLWASLVLV